MAAGSAKVDVTFAGFVISTLYARPAAGVSSKRPRPSWIDLELRDDRAPVVDHAPLDVGRLPERGLGREVDPARQSRDELAPSGNSPSATVFITMGMRFCIDSVTPPSSASSVNRPSPRAIAGGKSKRAVAFPSLSVRIATRATSRSSTVTTPVIGLSANGSPVARPTSIATATVSPAPYALRTNSTLFLSRGASYVFTTILRASRVPSSAASWIAYSPPSIPAGSSKSHCPTPPAKTRFVATIAPRGDTSWSVTPDWLAASVPVARRSARTQIVSPGWYRGLSVMM